MCVRKEKREKRRQQILEAALDLFISKGYAETKVADIAEKACMSAGLLFHYFESKAKLYEELIRIGMSSGPTSMMALDASDPLRFFETAAAYILCAVRESPFAAKVFIMMEQASLSESMPEAAIPLAKAATIYEKAIPIIEEGQARGQLREGRPMALSILFWQALSGVALYAALDPEAPIPEPGWIVDCIRKEAPKEEGGRIRGFRRDKRINRISRFRRRPRSRSSA